MPASALGLVLVVLAGCAHEPPAFGPATDELLDCRADDCPPSWDVVRAEGAFAECYDGDPGAAPTVIWRQVAEDGRTIVDSWGREVEGAHNRGWLETGTWGAWVHERIHVAHLYEGITVEATHDEPAGPWPRAVDHDCEYALKFALRSAFGRL
jgi:hypothetical protein